jgi:hypothetical protein
MVNILVERWGLWRHLRPCTSNNNSPDSAGLRKQSPSEPHLGQGFVLGVVECIAKKFVNKWSICWPAAWAVHAFDLELGVIHIATCIVTVSIIAVAIASIRKWTRWLLLVMYNTVNNGIGKLGRRGGWWPYGSRRQPNRHLNLGRVERDAHLHR